MAASSDFIVIRELGSRGNFGELLSVVHEQTGKRYVLRKMKASADGQVEQFQKGDSEVKIFDKIGHSKFIVEVYCSYLEGELRGSVMEFCDMGSLEYSIQEAATNLTPFSDEQIKFWLAQISMAVNFIHQRQILHRNISTSNILLKRSQGKWPTAKLGDFRVAIDLESDVQYDKTVAVGSLGYRAPEILQNATESIPYSFQSDVWALGLVGYQLAALKFPFEFLDENQLKAAQLKPLDHLPDHLSGELSELIEILMLNVRAEDRATMPEILESAALRDQVLSFDQQMHKMEVSPAILVFEPGKGNTSARETELSSDLPENIRLRYDAATLLREQISPDNANRKSLASNIPGERLEYKFEKNLTFGPLSYEQLYVTSGRPIVIKRTSLDKLRRLNLPELTDPAKYEAAVLSKLSHPNIVRALDFWKDEEANEIAMAVEFCPQGTIEQAISHQRKLGIPFSERQLKQWLFEIADGLAYVHNAGFVHGCLTPKSLLLAGLLGEVVKITDFSCVKLGSYRPPASCFLGVVAYMAPEMFAEDAAAWEESFQPPVDVWAFGVIALQLSTLELPFKQDFVAARAFFANKSSCARHLSLAMDDVEKTHSIGLRNLIESRLLVMDKLARATMDNVFRDRYMIVHSSDHPFFDRRSEEANSLPLSGSFREYATPHAGVSYKLPSDSRRHAQVKEKSAHRDDELIAAVVNGQARKVRELVRSAFDANIRLGPIPILVLAARNGCNEIVRVLLLKGANASVETDDEDRQTALQLACLAGNLEMVQMLVAHHADLLVHQPSGTPALTAAATAGQLQVVKYLLSENWGTVNQPDKRGLTALGAALLHGHCDVAELLLAHQANVNALTKYRWSPLMLAANQRKINKTGLIRKLITAGNVNATDNYGLTSLSLASFFGNDVVVDVLIENGAIVNWADADKSTPLILAAKAGHVAIVTNLLRHLTLSDIEAKDKFGGTAMFYAGREGHLDIVEILHAKAR